MRCKYELLVEKYFGLPDTVKEDTIMKNVNYGLLVDLVCRADQEFNSNINIEGKELFEWVKARIDYLKSIKLTEFGEGTLSAYELVYEWLKPVKTKEQKGNDSDAVEFVKFAFDNYMWTGETWDENTGHDDFESYTHEELYKLFKQSKHNLNYE